MKNIVVFGADSFIGNALVKRLYSKKYNVIEVIPEDGLVLQRKGDLINKKIIRCDLENIEAEFEDKINDTIDVIYFFAWDGLDLKGLNSYSKQIMNIKNMLDLLRISKNFGCKKFIGAGSITQQELMRDEGRFYLTDKHKYYRSAQQACEDMGRALANELNIDFIWPMITNVYGVGESSPRLINSLIKSLLNGKDFYTSAGKQLYDFVYIDDVAEIYLRLGSNGKSNKRYIIGSGKPRKLREYLISIYNLIDTTAELRIGEFEYKGMHYKKDELFTKQLFDDIGFIPEITFEHGILKTIDWIKKVNG